MPPITSRLRAILWIITILASSGFAGISLELEPNIRYYIRKVFSIKKTAGKTPERKNIGVWITYWMLGIIAILGTSIASSAPEKIELITQTNIINEINSSDSNYDERGNSPTITPISTKQTASEQTTKGTIDPISLINYDFFGGPYGLRIKFPDEWNMGQLPSNIAKSITQRINDGEFNLDEFSDISHNYVGGSAYTRLEITNTQEPGGPWIMISNKADIIVDSYEQLESIHSIIIGSGGLGGSGKVRKFSEAFLENSNISVEYNEADFFKLQPGEFEVLGFNVECGAPGIYEYHIEVDVTFSGNKNTISSPKYNMICPKYNYVWITSPLMGYFHFYAVEELVCTGDELGKCEYERNDDLVPDDPDLYYIQSTFPCEDSPPSYIDIYWDKQLFVNPDLNDQVFIREDAGLDQPIIGSLNPGEYINLDHNSRKCKDNHIWLKIYQEENEEKILVGWVAEGTFEKRWLFNSFEKDKME